MVGLKVMKVVVATAAAVVVVVVVATIIVTVAVAVAVSRVLQQERKVAAVAAVLVVAVAVVTVAEISKITNQGETRAVEKERKKEGKKFQVKSKLTSTCSWWGEVDGGQPYSCCANDFQGL